MGRKLETTLGELIVALTDASSQYTTDEDEAGVLVAYLLSDLLDKSEERGQTCH